MPKRKIAAALNINVKTVRSIIANPTAEPDTECNRQKIDAGLLSELYGRCSGYVQRMHEILLQEHGIDIGSFTRAPLRSTYIPLLADTAGQHRAQAAELAK
jgi:hypothetical protein